MRRTLVFIVTFLYLHGISANPIPEDDDSGEGFSDVLGGAWSKVKGAFETVAEKVDDAKNSETGQAVIDGAKNVGETIGDAFKDAGEGISDAFSDAKDSDFGKGVQDAVSSVGDSVKDTYHDVKDGDFVQGVKDGVSSIGDSIKDAYGDAKEEYGDDYERAKEEAKEKLKGLKDAFTSFFS